MPHSFHTVRRAVQLSVSSVALALYAVQFYLDRHAMRRDKRSRTFWRSKRVIRLSGASTALLTLLVGVDVVGAFGIYGVAPIFVISFLTLVSILSAFVFVFYRALVAAFPFTFHNSAKAIRHLRRAVLVFFVVVCACELLGDLVRARSFQVGVASVEFVLAMIFLLTVLLTFFSLWRQQRFLSNKDVRRSRSSADEGRDRELARILKQWRVFSLLVVVICAAITASFSIRVRDNLRHFDEPLESLEDLILGDPEVEPEGAPFDPLSINSWAVLVLIYIELWYTWLWRPPPETDSSAKPATHTSTTQTYSGVSTSDDQSGAGRGTNNAKSRTKRASKTAHAAATRTRADTLGSDLSAPLSGRARSLIDPEKIVCAAEDSKADKMFDEKRAGSDVESTGGDHLDVPNSCRTRDRVASLSDTESFSEVPAALTRSPSPSSGASSNLGSVPEHSSVDAPAAEVRVEMTETKAGVEPPEHSV